MASQKTDNKKEVQGQVWRKQVMEDILALKGKRKGNNRDSRPGTWRWDRRWRLYTPQKGKGNGGKAKGDEPTALKGKDEMQRQATLDMRWQRPVLQGMLV